MESPGADGGGRVIVSSSDGAGDMHAPRSSCSVQIPVCHHVLLPLTCKQIGMLDCSDDDEYTFISHGVEVSTVRLVGRMLERVDLGPEIRFAIDDGTSRIDARMWINGEQYPEYMLQAKDGDYIIVNGGLRGSGSARFIEAYSIKCVENYNDITHHFLQCIYAHLDLKSKAKARSLAIVVQDTATTTDSQRSTLTVKDNGLSLFDNVIRVFDLPGVRALENGASFSLISSMTGAQEHDLRSVIDAHITLGNMFATVDDNHFKASYNG